MGSTGIDFSALTAAVDFSTVSVAVLAISALQMLPLVAKWGAGKIKGMMGR